MPIHPSSHLARIVAAWGLALAAAVHAAPPANDDLAAAVELTTGVADSSTTVDATLESGEPVPAGFTTASYQGTVWWDWTPAFTGWYEVSTTGSAADTVLSIWTGSGFSSPLSLVHVNDETGTGTGHSTIRFLATVDSFNPVPFKVAVASRSATRGAVTLNASAVPTTFSRVTAASFSPTSVSAATSAANITADITLQSGGEIESGTIKLYDPSNNEIASAPVSGASRISGVIANGVYRMTLVVPQGSVAGQYKWGINMKRESSSDISSYGWEGLTPLPAGVPAFVTVTGAPPVITRQPWDLQVEVGAAAETDIAATGGTVSYTWRKGLITASSSSVLAFPNYQTTNAGSYVCSVSNSDGTASSRTVSVTTASSFGSALEDTTRKWWTTGDAMWSTNSGAAAHDGVDAMRAGGTLLANQRSVLATSVSGPLTLFWWQRLTGGTGDRLTVSVDGLEVSGVTGTAAWEQRSTIIDAGVHRVEFAYLKDGANSSGSEAAWIDTITTGPPFTITQPPESTLANAGSNVTLSITTTGLPTTYQWRRNGVNITGATADTLALNGVTSLQAGDYSCLVGGTTSSSIAKLIVITPGAAARPKATGTAVLKVTPSSTAGVTYQWLDPLGGITTDDGRITGARSATLTVRNCTTADEGLYTCRVKAFTPEKTLPSTPVELDVVTVPVIDISGPALPPHGIVSAPFSWQVQASQFPTRYRLTGLPPGLVFDATKGILSGTPNAGGSFKVNVTATNAAGTTVVTSFTVDIDKLPDGTTGIFSGVVARESDINASFGGKISITIATSGTWTGAVQLGAKSTSIKGRMTSVLGASLLSGSATVTGTSRTIAFTVQNNVLSGSIDNGPLHQAVIDGGRQSYSTASPTALKGLYNFSHALPSGRSGSADTPQGAGYTQMNITSSGSVTTTGRLSDGTVLTQSSALWADGRAPLFVMLYASKGSILGTHTAHMATPAANLSWFKAGPSSTSDRTYAAGFAEIGLVSDGVRYVAQPGTVLALPAPPDNARLLFAEGGLASAAQVADLNQLLSISTTNVATLRTKTTGNPCLVTLKVTASTGLFSGTFTLTDGAIVRKAFYYGVLLPHRGASEGFFTLRQLPNTAASPILSGSARLTGP